VWLWHCVSPVTESDPDLGSFSCIFRFESIVSTTSNRSLLVFIHRLHVWDGWKLGIFLLDLFLSTIVVTRVFEPTVPVQVLYCNLARQGLDRERKETPCLKKSHSILACAPALDWCLRSFLC